MHSSDHRDVMKSKTGRRPAHPVRVTFVVLLTGVACLAGAILAINASPHLLLTLLGFEQRGPVTAAPSAEPAPLTLDGASLDHVDLALPPQVVEPLKMAPADTGKGQLPCNSLFGDASTPGITRYLLCIDEEGVNELLWTLVFHEGLGNGRYRNVTIDLQPGGLIAYADVYLGIRWQRMGLLLLQDGEKLAWSPSGVALNGELYAMPGSRSLARLLLPGGRQAQSALHALTIVGPLPGEARVDVARFHQDRLQILAQATYAMHTLPDTGWRAVERGVELREINVAAGAGRPTERLSIVRLNPAEIEIRVDYDPSRPKTISAWGATSDALLVVSGSYFAPESEGKQETIGLLISDGQRFGTPLQDHAGMLAVTRAGEVSIRWLRRRPYDPEEPLTQAMQSFPVLVKPGGVMGFPAEADDGAPARRTVIAQDVEGRILFAVAPRGMLSLHDLAVFLADSDLVIDVALNLDGGGSTGMWLTATGVQVEIDSFTPVPSVITVERR